MKNLNTFNLNNDQMQISASNSHINSISMFSSYWENNDSSFIKEGGDA